MIRAATADDPLRIAVLASGRGSNLAALMERLDPAVTIVAVASNRSDAVALQRAREEEIETAVFPRGDDWAERDRRLLTWLVERQVELVVLAGFMEILTAEVVDHLPVINVHPSPLHERIQAVEHRLLPDVVRRLAADDIPEPERRAA